MLNNLRSILGSPTRELKDPSPERGATATSPPRLSAETVRTPPSQVKKVKKVAVLSVGVPLEEAFGQPTTPADQQLFIFGNGAMKLAVPPKRPPRPTTQLASAVTVSADPSLVFTRARPSAASYSAVQPLFVYSGQPLSAGKGTLVSNELPRPPPRSNKGKTIVLEPDIEADTTERKSVSPPSNESSPAEKQDNQETRKRRVIQETLQRMRQSETDHAEAGLIINSAMDTMPLPRPQGKKKPSPNSKQAQEESAFQIKRSPNSAAASSSVSPDLRVSRARRLSELPPSSRSLLSRSSGTSNNNSREGVGAVVDPLSPFILQRQKKKPSPQAQEKLSPSQVVTENVAKFAPPAPQALSPAHPSYSSPTKRSRGKKKPLYLDRDEPSSTELPITDPVLLRLHRQEAKHATPKSPFEAMKKRMELASGATSPSRKREIRSGIVVAATEPYVGKSQEPPLRRQDNDASLPPNRSSSIDVPAVAAQPSRREVKEELTSPAAPSEVLVSPSATEKRSAVSLEPTASSIPSKEEPISPTGPASEHFGVVPPPPPSAHRVSPPAEKAPVPAPPVVIRPAPPKHLPPPPSSKARSTPPTPASAAPVSSSSSSAAAQVPPSSASASSTPTSPARIASPPRRKPRRSLERSSSSEESPSRVPHQKVAQSTIPGTSENGKKSGRNEMLVAPPPPPSPPVSDRRMDRSVTITSLASSVSSGTTATATVPSPPAVSSVSSADRKTVIPESANHNGSSAANNMVGGAATSAKKQNGEADALPANVFKKQHIPPQSKASPRRKPTPPLAPSPKIPRRSTPYVPPPATKEDVLIPPPRPLVEPSVTPPPPPPPPPPKSSEIDTRTVKSAEIREALNSLPHLPSPQIQQAKSSAKKDQLKSAAAEAATIPQEEGKKHNDEPQAQQRSESERRLAAKCREFLDSKRPQQALDVCDEWRKLNPNSGEAWLLAGRAHLLKGEASPAEHCLNNSMSLYKGNDEVFKLIQRDLNRLKTMINSRDKCLEELAKRGSAMAVSHATRAQEIAPCNPQLCVLKAAALLVSHSMSGTSEGPAAMGNAEDGEEKSKRQPATAAVTELFKQELDRALSLATMDLVSQIGRPAVQYARVMHRAGLTSEADSLLEEICDRAPKASLPSCVELLKTFRSMESAKSDANEAYSQGKYAESIKLFTQALQLDPVNDLYNSILFSNRAASYMALGDYQRAVDDCDSALRLVPSFLRARLRRARALQKMGKFRESIADFELAMRVNPSPSIAQELADARKALKDHQDKKKMFHMRGFASHFSSSSSNGSSSASFDPGFAGPLPRPTQAPPGGYSRRPPPPPSSHQVMEDLYKILGISPQASSADIKKAYHRAALKHHPDKNQGDSEASQRFKKVLDAFHTLSDPQSRRKYDLMFSVSVPMM